MMYEVSHTGSSLQFLYQQSQELFADIAIEAERPVPERYLTADTYLIYYIWSSPRSISIGQLNMLPCLHPRPINLVFFKGSY